MILLTGASGYVGGRLLHVLEGRGLRVRCLARRPEFLTSRVSAGTEVVGGDVLDRESLDRAFIGVQTAYYLVHSLAVSRFEESDRQAAENFAAAAKAAGVRRIVYLGGLADEQQELSTHLKSRHEVGAILRASEVPTIEFRASIVIGSGSLSFEIVRALVERLPVMITPRWVSVPAQPIAIDDLLAYLVAALDVGLPHSQVVEIGGADVVSYGGIMREYARARGLRRWMISVPVLTPHLSSLWLGLVTPVYARVGRHLINSVRHPSIVQNHAALRMFPIRPRGVHEAITAALRNEDREFAETRWSDALSAGPAANWGGQRFGSRIVDLRSVKVPVSAAAAFAPIQRIGGNTGWYYARWLWRLRGWIDLLVGGVGLRRGRRRPDELAAGDTVDFWRVEAYVPDERLRLAAEMKLPGRAWLEFEVQNAGDESVIRQTAIFDPVGIAGQAYWYLLYPLHQFVFAGMLREIARAAVKGG